MATSGDITGLDILQFDGVPMIPTISGFSRVRKSAIGSVSTAILVRSVSKKREESYAASAVATGFLRKGIPSNAKSSHA